MAKSAAGVLKVVAVDQYGIVIGRSSLVSLLDTTSRTPSGVAKVFLTDEYGQTTALAIPTPENMLLAAEGLVAQTFPRWAMQTSSIPTTNGTTGTMVATAMAIRAGQVVANLSVSINSAATSMVLGKLALYKADGTLLASTASQTTAWESTGMKTVALSSAYTIKAADLTNGCVYAAILSIATTNPGFNRAAAGTTIVTNVINSGIKPWTQQLTQTDLPSSATFANSGTAAFWVGAS